MSVYSLRVALRASMAPKSHPGASSAKSIFLMWWGTVLQRRRNDSRRSSSSRWRSSVEGCSEVLSAVMVAGVSTTAVTSHSSLSWVRDSKVTRRREAEAVLRMSPGSRSRYPVRGIVCRPEVTKCSEGYWLSWVVAISTI